jgi:KipI family sensor histidine kinase inhibitor
VLVYYNPLVASFEGLRDSIDALQDNLSDENIGEPQVIHVPTLYGGDYGPDIEFVAEHAGISVEEVIEIHSGTNYLIYMMGFAPGFSYLGGLSEKLATPRLTSPRTEIPAGSVGIAESQTGIYPIASPGGWQLIGRTPLKMFDPARESPALLNPGDYVRFDPLESEAEYNRIRGLAEEGRYQLVTSSPA